MSAEAGWPLTFGADVEQLIVQWILEARDLQLPGQWKMIQRKAAAARIAPDHPNFHASDEWLQKFMRWNSLPLHGHTSIQQKFPADLEKTLENLMDTVKTWREQHNLPDELFINMDETPLHFDIYLGQVQSWRGVPEKFVFEVQKMERNS